MRINIAASHRFHLLDLARELEKLGHDVRFYSYVPTKRAMQFGLKKENSFSLFYIMIPFLLFFRLTKGSATSKIVNNLFLDNYMSFFMKPCDVYIANGYTYRKSYIAAKKKFGALTINDWGSKHIVEQLKQFGKPKSNFFSNISLKRELTAYDNADFIAIPATHVKESFLLHGVNESKLLINPYGVDLRMFYPTKLSENSFDLIFVGGWRYEKGCDLLIELCEKFKYRLLHVGAIVGLQFPKNDYMVHIDSVDQCQLVNYYSQAKVFVLPSRAEGLALVQAQAIACGLPIVCSKNTGGVDLRNLLDDKKWIIEMDELTVDCLNECIENALFLANTQKLDERNYAGVSLNKLTWKLYGERYNDNLNRLIENNAGEL